MKSSRLSTQSPAGAARTTTSTVGCCDFSAPPAAVVADLVADAKVPVTDKQKAMAEDYFER